MRGELDQDSRTRLKRLLRAQSPHTEFITGRILDTDSTLDEIRKLIRAAELEVESEG